MFDIKTNGVYKLEEVQEGLGVSKGTVYNMINEDGLKSTRIRGYTYVRGSDLLSFLFGQEEAPKLKSIAGGR